jgi:hypothetical protein
MISNLLSSLKGSEITPELIDTIRGLEEQRPNCFLYFIRDGFDGYVKIGKTVDLMKRLSSIQTSLPKDIYVDGFIMYNSNMINLESKIHRELSQYNKRGEWFNLTKVQTEGVIRNNNGVTLYCLLKEFKSNFTKCINSSPKEKTHTEIERFILNNLGKNLCSDDYEVLYNDEIRTPNKMLIEFKKAALFLNLKIERPRGKRRYIRFEE